MGLVDRGIVFESFFGWARGPAESLLTLGGLVGDVEDVSGVDDVAIGWNYSLSSVTGGEGATVGWTDWFEATALRRDSNK